MKILVPVKRVVDPCVAVRVKPDASGIDASGVRMSMNPFDEIAVEAAVRFREAGVAAEVVAVSCGVPASQEVLRTAMAIGADRGILVETANELSPLAVAKLLKAVCAEEKPDLVICGKQAVDDDANQTGQMLAALLGWPQATFASALDIVDGRVCVTRDLDDGREALRLPMPAVVTTELGLNEPRYATLPNIMKARKKPLRVVAPGELGGEPSVGVMTIEWAEPPVRRAGVRVESVTDLVDRLRAAKVL
ncbi:electron transfer flavoprotein subunit beta/FixA family protein [Propionivibrio dicarboxylicus]|uniref:Electron transfer flavoprotein subunit beta n=1 Tax=Propionivibrio dicarboxylicus TaxID=83767 RepID=A0A1G7Y1I5_9RHOO|nr:electron transfer flavoprotein subunit beta/FixA family protein [Propionivibrio dicarboxylicus]SDG90352.1 electron transfer flavoprotein beta subunit [Propionivibrio dicarboxylicus]